MVFLCGFSNLSQHLRHKLQTPALIKVTILLIDKHRFYESLLNVSQNLRKGPFKCYVKLFSGKLDPHPPPRNVEPYIFTMLFSGTLDPPQPSALRNYVTLEWPLGFTFNTSAH